MQTTLDATFLYGFKAARRAARAAEHGGHARPSAGAPGRTGPTPVGWREVAEDQYGPPFDSKQPRATADLTREPSRRLVSG